MSYNPDIHHRRSIRLSDHDYSLAGIYFITLCVHEREDLFGTIKGEEMVLNEYGIIVKRCWEELPAHYPEIVLDECIVMPNHFHGIIEIVGAIHESPDEPQRQQANTRRGMLLSKIVSRLKMNSSKQINVLRATSGFPVWQRNYYEHIVRNTQELDATRDYIRNNPMNWGEDKENGLRKVEYVVDLTKGDS